MNIYIIDVHEENSKFNWIPQKLILGLSGVFMDTVDNSGGLRSI